MRSRLRGTITIGECSTTCPQLHHRAVPQSTSVWRLKQSLPQPKGGVPHNGPSADEGSLGVAEAEAETETETTTEEAAEAHGQAQVTAQVTAQSGSSTQRAYPQVAR